MSRVLAGPWAAQLLADLGADVVKLERPEGGDDSRAYEPAFHAQADPHERLSAYFCAANRGKRSVAIDFATPAGAQRVRALAARADVLIENYKTGTLARHGLGYEDLRALNPRLVYCSVTGFGQTGPYAARAGYDTIIQAIGGMMSITGERDGLPGASPQRTGLPIIDVLTGVYAALATMVALRERDRTGRGQAIDLALLDVQVSALSYFAMNYFATGQVPRRQGNTNAVSYPSGLFPSADGSVLLLVGNDGQFVRFCEALGQPGLAADPRFAANRDRMRHAPALAALISPLLAARPSAHWLGEFEARGVPCGPINDLQAVFDDPQVRERGLVREVDHPLFGTLPLVANPLRFSATAMRYERPPPRLGEHTDAVLAQWLGAAAGSAPPAADGAAQP